MAKMKISEERALDEITKFIEDTDYDTLARLIGEIFGGDCFVSNRKSHLEPITFDFEPNELYSEAFDDLLEYDDNFILSPSEQ